MCKNMQMPAVSSKKKYKIISDEKEKVFECAKCKIKITYYGDSQGLKKPSKKILCSKCKEEENEKNKN
jgi:hypothetical protein